MDLIVDFPQTYETSDPIRRSKQVTFTNEDDVTIIENLTFEYRNDLWFTDRDLRSFRFQLAHMLRTLHANDMTIAEYAEIIAQDTSSFLGLENYLTETTSREIRYQKRALRAAILFEQSRQLQAGIHDPDTMANISEVASNWSRKRAQIIALIHSDER